MKFYIYQYSMFCMALRTVFVNYILQSGSSPIQYNEIKNCIDNIVFDPCLLYVSVVHYYALYWCQAYHWMWCDNSGVKTNIIALCYLYRTKQPIKDNWIFPGCEFFFQFKLSMSISNKAGKNRAQKLHKNLKRRNVETIAFLLVIVGYW